MERITEQRYREAKNLIKLYEEQIKKDRLDIYKGCTKDNILKINATSMYGQPIVYYWVTKGIITPDRNPDNTITTKGGDFYTIENSQKVYATYDDAEKAIIQSFKRKKLIDN